MVRIDCGRCATTSIFDLLNEKELVCGRWGEEGVAEKEAHFFDDGTIWKNIGTSPGQELKSQKALTEYLSGYPEHRDKTNCTSNYLLDATPAYLRQYDGARRMQAVMPSALRLVHSRHLIVLREPIARDMSFYNMFRGEWLQVCIQIMFG